MVTWLVSHSEGIFGGAAFGIQNRTTPSKQSRYTQTIQNKHPPKQSRYTKNNPHPNNPNIHRTDTRLNNQMHRHKQDNEETKQTHPNNPNVLHRQNKADLATTIKTIKIFYIDKTIKKQSNGHPNKYWRNINPIETVKKRYRDKTCPFQLFLAVQDSSISDTSVTLQ